MYKNRGSKERARGGKQGARIRAIDDKRLGRDTQDLFYGIRYERGEEGTDGVSYWEGGQPDSYTARKKYIIRVGKSDATIKLPSIRAAGKETIKAKTKLE